eukprot:TRINITY_DN6840_c0_g1_i3.p1 TRINITY_DN6840_c0_g1~~TRINITY_DN6840_c0_g1_i3.p1  ORF type:complete len:101 (+),score=5.37 TRINITY_DN6840_c0_g1_i3:250-552(+)
MIAPTLIVLKSSPGTGQIEETRSKANRITFTSHPGGKGAEGLGYKTQTFGEYEVSTNRFGARVVSAPIIIPPEIPGVPRIEYIAGAKSSESATVPMTAER